MLTACEREIIIKMFIIFVTKSEMKEPVERRKNRDEVDENVIGL
jgi:hypothetical protein